MTKRHHERFTVEAGTTDIHDVRLAPRGITVDVMIDGLQVNLIGKGYPAPRKLFRWCTSAASKLNLRVDGGELTAGVVDFHLPVDAALGRVHVG